VIPPSIDPFSSKNRDVTDGDVGRVLRRVALVAGVDSEEVAFTRRDGTPGVVRRHENLSSGSRLLLLLADSTLAAALGRGRVRVREDFMGDQHLIQYVDLFDGLLAP
jgi:hypothetical protein